MKNHNTLGAKRLRELKEEKELSYGDIAKILDVSRAFAYRLVQGKRSPSVVVAIRIWEQFRIGINTWAAILPDNKEGEE